MCQVNYYGVLSHQTVASSEYMLQHAFVCLCKHYLFHTVSRIHMGKRPLSYAGLAAAAVDFSVSVCRTRECVFCLNMHRNCVVDAQPLTGTAEKANSLQCCSCLSRLSSAGFNLRLKAPQSG